jgi:hypothetical protein
MAAMLLLLVVSVQKVLLVLLPEFAWMLSCCSCRGKGQPGGKPQA